jgi:hypothetical protein
MELAIVYKGLNFLLHDKYCQFNHAELVKPLRLLVGQPATIAGFQRSL